MMSNDYATPLKMILVLLFIHFTHSMLRKSNCVILKQLRCTYTELPFFMAELMMLLA